MQEPTDPLSLAILRLEAQSLALQKIVALLLCESPSAVANLELLVNVSPESALNSSATDGQIAALGATLRLVLAQVLQHRATGAPTPTPQSE
jgi:hypothetical protein